MTLSNELEEALELLCDELGRNKIPERDVERHADYEALIERGLQSLIRHYELYKAQQGTDWEEIDRKREEEEARIREERKSNVADGAIIGAMATLMPKISGLTEYTADFELGDEYATIDVRDDDYDSVFAMTYNRKKRALITTLYSPYREYEDKVTGLKWAKNLQEQIEGLKAVQDLLDAKEDR